MEWYNCLLTAFRAKGGMSLTSVDYLMCLGIYTNGDYIESADNNKRYPRVGRDGDPKLIATKVLGG